MEQGSNAGNAGTSATATLTDEQILGLEPATGASALSSRHSEASATTDNEESLPRLATRNTENFFGLADRPSE